MRGRKVDSDLIRFVLQIDPNDPDGAICSFVLEWFNLLLRGKAGEACSSLDESNPYGEVWTPESIERVVNWFFSKDTIFYREFGEPRFSSQKNSVTQG